jgi:protein-S-isoprenylcysteine O-methyltransferase
MLIGLVMCVGGQCVRSYAMWTCGHNFTHIVAERKKDEHVLVQHGIYSVSRHPSYFGWFWWSVGTQVLLCNPICCAAYAVVSYRFFRDRIAHEEATLRRFFPEQYPAYAARVPTLIPFIK